jgi:hypothetical protein
MSSNLSITAPADGHGSEGHAPNPRGLPRRPAEAADGESPAPPADPGQRLVIEETADGGLVYTVIDRASGAVVARTSREDVALMSGKPDYAAGALIRAKA